MLAWKSMLCLRVREHIIIEVLMYKQALVLFGNGKSGNQTMLSMGLSALKSFAAAWSNHTISDYLTMSYIVRLDGSKCKHKPAC